MRLTRNPKCTACRLHATTSHVCLIGDGPIPCEVMVVGEAPGATEEEQGKPFVGKAGQLLRNALEDAGIDTEAVFFTNAVLCRPPDNKTPTKGEVKKCHEWLKYQTSVVQPKYVVLLGNTALLSVTGLQGITRKRGIPFDQDGILYFPMYHPSFVLRDPSNEFLFHQDCRTLKSIIESGGVPEEKELNVRVVLTDEDFDDMLEALEGTVSVDHETTGLYPFTEGARILTLGFGTEGAQWILPTGHKQSPWSRDQQEDMVEQITEKLDDCFTVYHNGKFDCLWTRVDFGVKWHNDFDTMLAHYLLDENSRHGLKLLAQQFCGAPDWDIDKTEKSGENTPLKKLAHYQAHDLYYTRELRYIFGRMLKDDFEVRRVFNKIMMPVANLFAEIEYDGVWIDTTKFDQAERALYEQYNSSLNKLKEWEPEYVIDGKGKVQPFNWGSTKQLSKLLFEDFGIPVVERTDAGNPSCSESVLKRIDHPCVVDLLNFRAAKQQLSFFIEGWKPYLHERGDGYYLHPSFKLHGTVTGRLSCENPNLQQVPRDKRIRSLISAPPGWTLVECDLSQIELRVAAELANEQAMLHAFATGIDIHWKTGLLEIARGHAMEDLVLDTGRTLTQNKGLTYGECIDAMLEAGHEACIEVNGDWKELRKKAKAVNFGYLYGMWWKKFKIYARDNYGVVIDDEDAEQSRETFFDNYSGLGAWHKRQKKYANRHGYVKSLSGRKRRLPDARRRDGSMEQKAAERQAINSPVQSFANELNLMAALQLRAEFGRDIVRICGTVHDAVLFRVKNSHVSRVTRRMLEIMRHPQLLDVFEIDMFVPIEAEASIGPWGAGISLEKWDDTQRRGNGVRRNRGS